MTQSDLAFLHAHGINVEPETLNHALELALRGREARVAAKPREEFTAGEARLLEQGGLDLTGARAPAGALASTAVDYAALIKASLFTREAAVRLGKDASRIRQRIGAGTLYAFRVDGDWRVPTFQFEGDALVPNIGRVVARLRRGLHPLRVERFFELPNPDLENEDGKPVSPREWLLAGNDAAPVARLAESLQRFGEVSGAGGRFDHYLDDPGGGGWLQSRGILYAGRHIGVCLAEVFQDGRFIDRHDSGPWLVAFSLQRRVKLLDLTGPWATRIGASVAIASGRRDRARRWSQALYDAYRDADGLAYGSSMYGGDLAIALYERAMSALPAVPRLNIPLGHPGLTEPLERVADRIGYALG